MPPSRMTGRILFKFMYYVYILKLCNGHFYKGSTGDLKRRLDEHEKGKVFSTKNKRPVKLIHYEAYLLKSDAVRREKFLKTTEGKRYLQKQIKDLLADLNSGVVQR